MQGYPIVFIDGTRNVEGAADCESARRQYQQAVEARLAETNGLSPVAISGDYTIGGVVTITASYELVDPVHLQDLRATLLVYENGVHGPADPYGYSIYNAVTRKIYDEPITLTNVNDRVVVTTSVRVENGWVADSLHCVAYLQQTSTKEMIQAANLPAFNDYSLGFPWRIRSVPAGNGIAAFPATLQNLTNDAVTVTLEPGIPFGDWTVDYLVCGDTDPHTGATEITLGPNETCNLTIRVHTDGAREVRMGSFQVRSEQTGRTWEAPLKVYNGSPSIFLVDNDASGVGEVSVIEALAAGGYLFEWYDVSAHGDEPTPYDMDGYDVVIWETGHRTAQLLDEAGARSLISYLDQGGALFLTSQFYLNTLPAEGNVFSRDYLGVASFVLDKGYHILAGLGGDPIGGGLILPLHFDYPSFYRGDDAAPTSSARTVLLAEDGSHAMLRNVSSSGAKIVFLADAFDGISQTDPDPNNAKVLLSRIISWLEPDYTAAAGETHTTPPQSLIAGARPNPFSRSTEIAFTLSERGAAGQVRLEVFDPTGRRVAVLLDGRLTPGDHSLVWNGRADRGGEIQSGIYLARLTTAEGSSTWKLVLFQ